MGCHPIRTIAMVALVGAIVGLGVQRVAIGNAPASLATTSVASWHASPSAHVNPCARRQLKVTAVSEGVAAGTRSFYVLLVNRGRHSCRIRGRPKVVLLSHGDRRLSTTQHPTTTTPTTKRRIRTVVLAPRGRGSFLVRMSGRGPTGSSVGECPILTGLRFTLVLLARSRIGTKVAFPTSRTPIAAYAEHPGGRCDEIGVSIIFRGRPRLGRVPARASRQF